MPAKTKSAPKSGKLGNFFRKLTPNSPKKKLLLFVVVFGLIAGGFYAYRTFAYGKIVKQQTPIIRLAGNVGHNGIHNTYRVLGAEWGKFNGSTVGVTRVPAGSTFKMQIGNLTPGREYCVWGFAGHVAVTAVVNSQYIRAATHGTPNPNEEKEIVCFTSNRSSATVHITPNAQIDLTNLGGY